MVARLPFDNFPMDAWCCGGVCWHDCVLPTTSLIGRLPLCMLRCVRGPGLSAANIIRAAERPFVFVPVVSVPLLSQPPYTLLNTYV